MTKTILAIALRKQKHNSSSIFEGINILPTELIKEGIPAAYVLFVNINVKPPSRLRSRLDMKTNNMQKKNEYFEKINEIVGTAHHINEDFELIDEKNKPYFINKLIIDNNNSINKTVRLISKQVRKVIKQNKAIKASEIL